MKGCGFIAADDEAANVFTLFALHLSHIYSKNIWNQMEINYHMMILFAMQYIHNLGGINHIFMSSHVKDKTK